ncbi:MAG: hypothetical protein JWO09_3934 [Bacteroidetes bacterium]|nr:hypothetical protein [Bacteroidota bacterium]
MQPELAQQLLNRLYTDERYLAEFLADRQLFYSKHQFTPETIAFLDALSSKQLSFYAHSLKAKRYQLVKQQIPAVCRIMKAALDEHWRSYVGTYVPQGIHKHHDDALHFLAFIEQQHLTDFLLSLIKFERLLIGHFIESTKIQLSFHAYDFTAEYQQILKKENYIIPQKKWTCILWRSGRIGMKISI